MLPWPLALFHYNELRIADLKRYLAEQNVPVRLTGWETI
jgi:imidazole glycerol phosphate synthase subunit HisF